MAEVGSCMLHNSSLTSRAGRLPACSIATSYMLHCSAVSTAFRLLWRRLASDCLLPTWQMPCSLTHGEPLLGCSRGSQPPASLVPQVLCALVAHDDSKQRWLQSAGVLQLLERLLQSNSAGPEASDELSLYLVSLLLSISGLS